MPYATYRFNKIIAAETIRFIVTVAIVVYKGLKLVVYRMLTFKTPIEGYQGSTFKQLSINENMNTEYLLQVINFYRKLLRENKIGSAIPHLNKKLFKEIKVSIPPYKEQQRIVDAINKAFMFLDMIMENL